jgi:UDP-sulfoquinovose synthase
MNGMRVLIVGGDGYLGWSAAMHLSKRGARVSLVDNFAKRRWLAQRGVAPLLPVAPLAERIEAWRAASGAAIDAFVGDMCDGTFMDDVLNQTRPDAIVHCAGQAAAPFAMLDREHAIETQRCHVAGSLSLLYAMQARCPDAQLIRIGAMGDYGTPNFDIEEGDIEMQHNGRHDRVPFPSRPSSFQHLAQAHESANYRFGAGAWGLRVTELKTGVVYGWRTAECAENDKLAPAYYYDAVFGSVLNRFCAQAAAGVPLTVYGEGRNKLAIINLANALQAAALAIEYPAGRGEFRVMNNFAEVFSVGELAAAVQRAAGKLGVDVGIDHVPNPRIEKPEYYYHPKCAHLRALGLQPIQLSDTITQQIAGLLPHKTHIRHEGIAPTVRWIPAAAN